MKKGFFTGMLALVAVSGTAWGQEETPPIVAPPIIMPSEITYAAAQPRVWGSAEYLLWWVKSNHLNSPLVATTNQPLLLDANGSSIAGGIGRPGTSVLVGDGNIAFGGSSGGRFTFGGWIDDCNTVGIEGRGFFLSKRNYFRSFASGTDGLPVIGVPVNVTNAVNNPFLTLSPGENAIVESFPLIKLPGPGGFFFGGFVGSQSVISHTQTWGAEVNGVFGMWRNDRFSADLVAGFRYANLQDDLTSVGVSSNTVPAAGFGGVAFLNNFFNGSVISTDVWQTRNQFYGGQLGVRTETQFGMAFLNVNALLAMGSTHQVVDIRGNSTLITAGGITSTNAGGTLALASNIGSYSRNQFSVIPEIEVKVGLNLTERLRGTFGYNFIYWTNVARSGEQVDRNVDVRQVPTVPAYDPSLHTNPVPQIRNTDFWAQGLTFGLEFRY